MSKSAQRKASAYRNGYQVGRYGWPPGVSFRVGVDRRDAWQRGLRDGKRDRRAAERLRSSWWRRLVSWLRRLVT